MLLYRGVCREECVIPSFSVYSSSRSWHFTTASLSRLHSSSESYHKPERKKQRCISLYFYFYSGWLLVSDFKPLKPPQKGCICVWCVGFKYNQQQIERWRFWFFFAVDFICCCLPIVIRKWASFGMVIGQFSNRFVWDKRAECMCYDIICYDHVVKQD